MQTMETFIPGQRWISNTESELGLGLILEVNFKRVTVLFLACDQRRTYAQDNAPLTRVQFSVGDTIESVDEEKLNVIALRETDGLITYICKNETGQQIELEEIELNHRSQFNKPQDRLFAGQTDSPAWFLLRYETWRRLQEHAKTPVKGLMGARTSLIPHQLFIAHEAATRVAPRIMLADEVGLGKTIEAGLILHSRLLNGLSQRVLIIVPESLLHQWLVEMLRRFNCRFSIFDEARCLGELNKDGFEADEQDNNDINPFASEQLILCSQQFFSHYPQRQQQALLAGWDMVIIDEAHHLQWRENAPSADYLFVEQLAQNTPSLILLTATPEQLGKESHFARLRLLDPDRFYSFAEFIKEEQLFEPVAEAAKLLLANESLTPAAQQSLSALLKEDNVSSLLKQLNQPEKSANARQSLINILLDSHGTGRILFRNSRQTVQGFPERERHAYPLAGHANEQDLSQDPRTLWLISKVKKLKGQKLLLICRLANTAIALEQTLKAKGGINSAVFHEAMTIIERDRAAAYFADSDSNVRLLICSEIGSEGRNFQFVHHLVLWDLPHNPDLLQQRIGRLDRIGQKHIIQLHIPYLQHSVQALLYQWYDQGLNAFRSNSSAAQAVADQLQPELNRVIALVESNDSLADKELNHLIANTQVLHAELEAELHAGRDQLLELNSCRTQIADDLIAQLSDYENEGTLWPYMEDIFECYGVDTEYHSIDCHILHPSDQLRVAHFPFLSEDGMTVTVNRAMALAREELQFLTWEHPLVRAAMDLVLSSDTGNATISVVKHAQLRGGQFLLECLFVLECSAPAELQVGRFLPHTPIRILIDQAGQDLTNSIAHSSLIESGTSFDKQQIINFLNKQRPAITKLVNLAQQRAEQQKNHLITYATETMLASLSAEIKRLVRLKKVNPTIKTEEIDYLKDMTLLIHENIQAAQCRLDAVRFIIIR